MTGSTAEHERLARLLVVDGDELEGLRDVPPDVVRRLHDLASDAMLDANRHALEPLVGLATRLPGRVLGPLIRQVLHPRIAARAVAVLPHEQAVSLAQGLPVDLLADVAAAADPRHLGPVISGVPTEMVAEVTAELVARGDRVTVEGLLPELEGERRDAAEAALGGLVAG